MFHSPSRTVFAHSASTLANISETFGVLARSPEPVEILSTRNATSNPAGRLRLAAYLFGSTLAYIETSSGARCSSVYHFYKIYDGEVDGTSNG